MEEKRRGEKELNEIALLRLPRHYFPPFPSSLPQPCWMQLGRLADKKNDLFVIIRSSCPSSSIPPRAPTPLLLYFSFIPLPPFPRGLKNEPQTGKEGEA